MAAGRLDQVCRGYLDLQPALPGAAEHRAVVQRGGVDHDGQPAAQPEWRDAAGYVAGRFFRLSRVGHRRLLAAGRGRQRLQVQRAGYRHDRDGERAVDVGDQSLENPPGRHAKRLAGFLAEGGMPRVVLVTVNRVRDARAVQHVDRPGTASACHGGELSRRPRRLEP